MIGTLMRGLNERDMQAVINTYDLKPYYYPTLFPLKETYTLTWKALETQVGLNPNRSLGFLCVVRQREIL